MSEHDKSQVNNPDLFELFKSAIAWGRVYGDAIPAHQWDEMRDSMAMQFQAQCKTRTDAEKELLRVSNDVCKHYWQFGANGEFEECMAVLKVCITSIKSLNGFNDYVSSTQHNPHK